jgi:hypothetical protein
MSFSFSFSRYNRYLYYYENDCPVIQVSYIEALIQLINENFSTDKTAILPATEAHYKNTLGKNKTREEKTDLFAIYLI